MRGELFGAPIEARRPKEPPTVTFLRQQIRRQASVAVLYRIAGSEAEFRRMVTTYGLDLPRQLRIATGVHVQPPPAKQLPPPARDRRSEEPLPQRQATLLGMLTHLAQIGEEFPGAKPLAAALEVSWLVVERDLRTLERKRMLRFSVLRVGDLRIRRAEICGTGLKTAVPTAAEIVKRLELELADG